MKKRILTWVVLCALLITACACFAGCGGSGANGEGTQGLKYKRVADGIYADGPYYIVTGIGSATDTKIVIPATYNDLPVAEIKEKTFADCSNLTSVTIPDSVRRIGDLAFSNCTNLKSVKFPNDIRSINGMVLRNCSNLKSVEIPSSVVRIQVSAFAECRSLTRIDFQGTKAEWNAIQKDAGWDRDTGNYTVHCSDGTIRK